MPEGSVEESVLRALAETDRSRHPLSQFLLLLGVVALLLLCAGITFVQERFRQQPARGNVEVGTDESPFKSMLVGAPQNSSFIVTRTGQAGKSDLYLCKVDPITDCNNLTESPAIAELWPTVDKPSQQVAYYALSAGHTDVYLLSLSDGTTRPLTTHAGDSGLHTEFEIVPAIGPRFSPSGSQIAFPAQAVGKDTTELFVVQVNGQQVMRVTDLGYRIADYLWLDDRTLVIASRRPDDTVDFWRVSIGPSEVRLEPLP